MTCVPGRILLADRVERVCQDRSDRRVRFRVGGRPLGELP